MATAGRLSHMTQDEIVAAIAQSGLWVDQRLDEDTLAVLRHFKVSDDSARAIVLAMHQPVDDYRTHEHLRRNRLTPAKMAAQARTTAEFARETAKRIQYMDPVVRAHTIGLGMAAFGKNVMPPTEQLDLLSAVLMKVADRVEAFAKSGRPKKISRNQLLTSTLAALDQYMPSERKVKRVGIARKLFQVWHIELPHDDNKLRKAAAQGKRTKTT